MEKKDKKYKEQLRSKTKVFQPRAEKAEGRPHNNLQLLTRTGDSDKARRNRAVKGGSSGELEECFLP